MIDQRPTSKTIASDSQAERKVLKADKKAADTARYEALAREHGADLSEEGFNEVLGKVAKPRR